MPPEGETNTPETAGTQTETPAVDDNAKALEAAQAALDHSRRENHAYRQMLGAHNVGTTLDGARLGSLVVGDDGIVKGDYGYKPAAPTSAPAATPPATPPSTPAPNATGALTREMLETMSHEEINKRWDEVRQVLSAPA